MRSTPTKPWLKQDKNTHIIIWGSTPTKPWLKQDKNTHIIIWGPHQPKPCWNKTRIHTSLYEVHTNQTLAETRQKYTLHYMRSTPTKTLLKQDKNTHIIIWGSTPTKPWQKQDKNTHIIIWGPHQPKPCWNKTRIHTSLYEVHTNQTLAETRQKYTHHYMRSTPTKPWLKQDKHTHTIIWGPHQPNPGRNKTKILTSLYEVHTNQTLAETRQKYTRHYMRVHTNQILAETRQKYTHHYMRVHINQTLAETRQKYTHHYMRVHTSQNLAGTRQEYTHHYMRSTPTKPWPKQDKHTHTIIWGSTPTKPWQKQDKNTHIIIWGPHQPNPGRNKTKIHTPLYEVHTNQTLAGTRQKYTHHYMRSTPTKPWPKEDKNTHTIIWGPHQPNPGGNKTKIHTPLYEVNTNQTLAETRQKYTHHYMRSTPNKPWLKQDINTHTIIWGPHQPKPCWNKTRIHTSLYEVHTNQTLAETRQKYTHHYMRSTPTKPWQKQDKNTHTIIWGSTPTKPWREQDKNTHIIIWGPHQPNPGWNKTNIHTPLYEGPHQPNPGRNKTKILTSLYEVHTNQTLAETRQKYTHHYMRVHTNQILAETRQKYTHHYMRVHTSQNLAGTRQEYTHHYMRSTPTKPWPKQDKNTHTIIWGPHQPNPGGNKTKIHTPLYEVHTNQTLAETRQKYTHHYMRSTPTKPWLKQDKNTHTIIWGSTPTKPWPKQDKNTHIIIWVYINQTMTKKIPKYTHHQQLRLHKPNPDWNNIK